MSTKEASFCREGTLKAFERIRSEEMKAEERKSLDEIAMGFIDVANEAMCRPIRALTQVGYSLCIKVKCKALADERLRHFRAHARLLRRRWRSARVCNSAEPRHASCCHSPLRRYSLRLWPGIGRCCARGDGAYVPQLLARLLRRVFS